MISRIPLTERQREASQRNFNRYNMLNGASYACLGETVVILFALKLGAPNVVAAAIGAMVFWDIFFFRSGFSGPDRSVRREVRPISGSAAILPRFWWSPARFFCRSAGGSPGGLF